MTVAALSCQKSTQKTQDTVHFSHYYHRRSPWTVGRADDVAGQHLLDLHHLLPSNSRVSVAGKASGVGASASQLCAPAGGVLPRSSSPWLKTSLNSRNRSFSCCCWNGERCSGKGGRCGGPGREAVGGVSARVTTSSTPIFCPECSWRESGWWLWMAIHSSGPLESTGIPVTNAQAERRWDRIKCPRRATGSGNE